MATVQEGDLVQLIGKDGKRFIFRARVERQMHTHRGIVDHDTVIGSTWGTEVKSHLGFPYLILQPSIHDLIMNIKRSTQIVYPKESAHILLKMNIGAGRRVIEAGTGSGALTIALAHAVGSTGRIYSYESRPEMSAAARGNLERLGLEDRVELVIREIEQGFDQSDVDALFLDVREPWLHLEVVRQSLAMGGFFGSLVPTTNQVQDLIRGLKRQRFIDIEALEIIIRSFKPVPGRLRPEDRLTAHTGYLIFARSTDRPAVDVDEDEEVAPPLPAPKRRPPGTPMPLP